MKSANQLPAGYSSEIYRSPVGESVRATLTAFLNHKDEIFQHDTEMRLRKSTADLFALAFHRGEPVAHAALTRSHPEPEVALLCHVFTAENHRKKGLATHLLSRLFSTFDAEGGRWATLGTTNPGAERIYRGFSFEPLNGALENENFIMLRTANGLSASDYVADSGPWQIVPFQRNHVPGTILLLNLHPASDKLPLCGINRGLKAERQLTKTMFDQDQGRCQCRVLIQPDTGRVLGISCTAEGQTQVYAPGTSEKQRAELRRTAASGSADE
jgi:GNAT superfamily N-acetyltransferase